MVHVHFLGALVPLRARAGVQRLSIATGSLSIDNSIDNTWEIRPRRSENQSEKLSQTAILSQFCGDFLSDFERFRAILWRFQGIRVLD